MEVWEVRRQNVEEVKVVEEGRERGSDGEVYFRKGGELSEGWEV